ncbi:MAG: phospholipase D family protein, partial [Comamonas sp.]
MQYTQALRSALSLWPSTAALLIAGLLTGCSLPPMPERTTTQSLSTEAATQSRLGQALAPLQQARPKLSGIHPLSNAYAAY